MRRIRDVRAGHVARPGALIDTQVNSAIIPSSPFFGQSTMAGGTGTGHPVFSFRESSFWMQAINVGVEFYY